MSKLYVMLPCYNEELNLAKLINKWYEEMGERNLGQEIDLEVVAVNDGSADKTESVLRLQKQNHDDITIINHPENKGLGQALKTGILNIVERAGEDDLVCIMDADNTQGPSYIHEMLNKMVKTECDCVIASRYQYKSKTIGVSILRNSMSLFARFVYSYFMKIPNVRDYTCGYRLYKTTALKKLVAIYKDNFITETGFTCMVELLYKLFCVGAKFEEIPFELRYDYKKGASKMNVLKNIIRSFEIAVNVSKYKS